MRGTAQRLQSQLGPADPATIDEYLDNVREVERGIALAGQQLHFRQIGVVHYGVVWHLATEKAGHSRPLNHFPAIYPLRSLVFCASRRRRFRR